MGAVTKTVVGVSLLAAAGPAFAAAAGGASLGASLGASVSTIGTGFVGAGEFAVELPELLAS